MLDPNLRVLYIQKPSEYSVGFWGDLMPAEEKRKELIVEAAAHLFSDKGFKDTSIAELSAITGVAEGTIFYHFKSKEHLLLHILDELHEKIEAEIEELS
jgi:AcrR family transcriptional regulator